MASTQPANAIDARAAAWVAREDRGPLDADEVAARDTWLQAASRHLGAYARARAAFVRLERSQALGPDFMSQSGAPPARPSRRRLPWHAAVAAGLCAVVLAGVLLIQGPTRHATALGEVLRVPLPDGSALVLNSNSQVSVDFSERGREVRLLKGEALFEVASDPERPFSVIAGETRVTAVGTAFSVHRGRSGDLEVIVREGVVDVDGGDPQPVRVTANFKASARPGLDLQIEPLQVEQTGRELAWSDGMLAFEGDTLAQAAAQFARYSNVRILIDDPEIAQKRVAGLYSATDPDGFAAAVAASMGLRIERSERGIHLRKPQVPLPAGPETGVAERH